jgi:hypothetical protein
MPVLVVFLTPTRIWLHASDDSLRFQQVPTFGHGTIRRFSTNASEMKKLAARNFEDLLQVSKFIFLSDD